MLIRLVRMTFRPRDLETFLRLFDETAPHIRAFPGCRHLELWQDTRFENVVTTCSHWTSADALEAYRHSPLFRETWARTKPLFAAAPQAFSHYPLRSDPTTDVPQGE
ncbi:MAG: antibiotic biosynthesis monooxygenase [Bacteroidetes bacterium]|nr:MAG: antibiotic biosynthesis monooxygenase [Bacteroidota bacterium]